jgi:hypothetical protein
MTIGYFVREIDVEALFDALFEDTDFILPKDVVNALTAGDKSVLGLDANVFGVANELRPHGDELRPGKASRSAVESIAELTAADEATLHRRHESDPDGAWGDFEAMGVVYRRGEPFPYWPAWLES